MCMYFQFWRLNCNVFNIFKCLKPYQTNSMDYSQPVPDSFMGIRHLRCWSYLALDAAWDDDHVNDWRICDCCCWANHLAYADPPGGPPGYQDARACRPSTSRAARQYELACWHCCWCCCRALWSDLRVVWAPRCAVCGIVCSRTVTLPQPRDLPPAQQRKFI